jgi:hypothetical protein
MSDARDNNVPPAVKIFAREAGSVRNVDVIPSESGMCDTALSAASRELNRIFRKAAGDGLNKDDTGRFEKLVNILEKLHALRKRLDAESDGDLSLPELRELGKKVLEQIAEEEKRVSADEGKNRSEDKKPQS